MIVLGRAAPCGELFRGAASSCGVRIPFWVEIKSSLMASDQAETQVLPACPVWGTKSLKAGLGEGKAGIVSPWSCVRYAEEGASWKAGFGVGSGFLVGPGIADLTCRAAFWEQVLQSFCEPSSQGHKGGKKEDKKRGGCNLGLVCERGTWGSGCAAGCYCSFSQKESNNGEKKQTSSQLMRWFCTTGIAWARGRGNCLLHVTVSVMSTILQSAADAQ